MPSYTYTAASSDAIKQAVEPLAAYRDNMTFKVLDIEQAPAAQGYEPHSYDIVVASHALHATDSLQNTVEHTRQLLKPGGYLVLLEVTDNGPIRFATIMADLASWRVGAHDDGRKYAPTVPPTAWHLALRKAGFGGIDTITPPSDGDSSGWAWPFSVMVAQAVDDKVNFLRRPLYSSSSPVFISSLVILGTGTLETCRIADELADSLGRFCGNVTILNGLPTEAEASSLDPGSTFINLVDLDSPIFKALTDGKMDGLKRVFELAKHILWITRGAQLGDEPYHAASLAFCRALSNEATHISFGALDIAAGVDGNGNGNNSNDISRVIAEQLLRQCALEELGDKNQLLWSREPETFLRHDGKLLVPRILPNLDQNARLNAARRVIAKTVPVSTSNFSIVSESGDLSRRCVVEDVKTPGWERTATLFKVEYSGLVALRIASDDAFLFLSIGHAAARGGRPVVALSTTNSRLVTPIVYLPVADAGNDVVLDADRLLVSIMGELLAGSVLQGLVPGSSLLVHCSDKDQFLVAALSRQAAAIHVRVTFSCGEDAGDMSPLSSSSWIRLSARTPGHAVRRRLLPVQPTHFLDLTAAHPQSLSDVGTSIARVAPTNCRRISLSDLSQDQAFLPRSFDREALMNRLRGAVASAKSSMSAGSTSIQGGNVQDMVLQLDRIGDQPSTPYHTTIVVRWPADGEAVKVEVRPMDSRHMFSKDKTYLLFGLSGQVGQSLCEWMASSGAGCVCLISRNPKVDQGWLESLQGTNTAVKVLAADVTDRGCLDSVLKTIRETCPPIGGVANGANVLSDAPFSAMSTEMMLRALGPKIDGSYNLDQAFYNDDLDFFVLFSSISCVIGTAGQSNYTAANGYLNGLARQRRGRGLAASAIDIGLILGIGLAEVAGQSVVDSLQKYGITPLSEPDLRLAFAESIQTGYPGPEEKEKKPSTRPAVVMTSGLRTITTDEANIVWYTNPIFAHLVIDTKGEDGPGDRTRGKAAALPVKEQLARAATKEEALQVLKDSFSAKLGVVLQNTADQEIPHDVPLVELGIDSLVAVEVRSWFLKMLKVDIPVLKLVGGSSLDEICELAMKRLPEDLVSQIGAADGPDAPPKPVEAPPQPAPQPRSEVVPRGGSSSASEDGATATFTPASTFSQMSLSMAPGHKGDVLSRTFVKSEPISIGQSRFWFLRLLVEDPTTFNVALKFRMTGTVRVGDLERALRVVTARHESLRTCFVEDENGEADQACQKIVARSAVRLERKTVSSVEEVADEYRRLRAHEFDLASGPLLRLVLVTLSPTSHYLLVNYHHIIMDMASFQVLTAELDRVYNGHPLDEPPPRQYPDFSVAQRRALEMGELSDELEYWRRIFPPSEQPPILPLLPMARSSSRVAITNYAVHQVSTRLEPALASRIKSVSKAQRSTPFHFYLAAFKAMLFAFSDATDLTIGMADANRHDSDVMGSIGFFLNLLTLRFHRQPGQTFADSIVEARNIAYAALANSRLPFDVVLKELNVARSSSYSPLFQAFFDYRQQTSDRQTWCNCQFELDEMHPGRTAYDISLDVADLGRSEDVHVTFRVQKSIYDVTAANLLLETYGHFVRVLAHDVSLALEDTPLFSEKQLDRAVQVGRGPDMLLTDWPATLPHRIDQIALENADKIALMDGLVSSLTYAAMTKRIEAIAEALLEAGVGPAARVLVFQQAAADWVCSMLAIMYVGGVYVPLDLRNPVSRLAAQAEHCQPSAVLADDTTAGDAPRLYAAAAVINVSRVASAPSSSTRIANVARPDSPAAILYTSGSTGTPKGIIIRHSGIRNEMEGYTKTYGLRAERVLQQSAFTFDFSVDQIFTGLVNGGMVYIVPSSKRGDPISITEIMRQQSITYTKVTPSEYSMWMQYGGDNLRQASSWRFAFAGGEPLTKTVLRQFAELGLAYQLRLYNSYGPAEVSIASHKGLIDYVEESAERLHEEDDRPVPCGFSLPNYATYILDENLKPLPVGMPGEVVIGGPGVSLGYLTNAELTARVFVPNPYATPAQVANGWTQMHRTGDIGYLQEDGSLVFRHRIAGDTQVKLRGLRIDLRDVEANIVSTAGGVLKEAVVTLREGDPDYLVAHVVFAAEQHHVGDKEAFLERLLSRLPLPQYMVPVLAVPLAKLPVSNHFKVDRKAIKAMLLPRRVTPAVDDAAQDDEDDANADAAETTVQQLRQLWREILPDSEKLGLAIARSTSFFSIGGNSLLVVRLQSRTRHVFGVAVRLVDLLNANTLGEMARKIQESPRVETTIDWDHETAPPSIPGFLANLPAKAQTNKLTILVTGATGNLAKHLLPALLADPRVAKIHCIAVRDKPRQQQSSLFSPSSDSDKVVYHPGDLTLPLLGLGVDSFRYLAEQADVILHLGAVRAFWDTYHMLRPTNVHATRELMKLAAVRRVPIHFVSTSGVVPGGGGEGEGDGEEEEEYRPPADGSDGYVASKWASERMLRRAAESADLALPSVVYRLMPASSSVVTSTTTTTTTTMAATIQEEQQNYHLKQQVLSEFLRCADLTNSLPDCADWSGRIDLIPALELAQWLRESLLQSTAAAAANASSTDEGEANTRVLQYESPVSVSVEELRGYLEERRGGDSGEEGTAVERKRLPLLKWMGRIKAVGFGYVLAAQDATLGVDGGVGGGKLRSRR